MPLILNIDTATPVCSVSLGNGDRIISFTDSTEDKAHSSHLAVFIDRLLQAENIAVKQLDAVAISKGPGSFTGLRIGVSVAKGLCYGGDIPLIAVDTLQAMASGMFEYSEKVKIPGLDTVNALYCPMIDARRMEVYTAMFDSGIGKVENTHAKIIDEQSYKDILKNRQVVFAGTGAEKCRESIKSENAFFLSGFNHTSRFMNRFALKSFETGRFEDVAYFEPYYLKDFIVSIPKSKIF